MRRYSYVILGGGVAAGYAADEFIERGLEPGQLAIISADDTVPYERPPLSKSFLQGEETASNILINDEQFYAENGIDVYLNSRVTRVEPSEKRLHIPGQEPINYEKLLICTGSHVNKLDIPGSDLEGVMYLRLLDDATDIRQRAERGEQVVVLGGGYIGMETAAVMRQLNLDTTMVFPESRLMSERFFTPAMSNFFEQYYRERDVRFVPNDLPVEIMGKDGKVSDVRLKSGKTLPADFVIAGIGVAPNDELFEKLSLTVDDGVVVNEYLETNADDIYAAGDIASYYDVIFDKQRRIGHWDNARAQGRYAARRMLGVDDEPFVKVPYFFSDVFDLSYEFWGEVAEDDQSIIRGDINSGSFSVWWLRGGRLVGAFVMDRPDEEREAARTWIASGEEIPVALLRNADKSLMETLS
ncbi:MAG: NAD(P)/FAD-dependent oxidoreductase [Chloroflexota bacterium]